MGFSIKPRTIEIIIVILFEISFILLAIQAVNIDDTPRIKNRDNGLFPDAGSLCRREIVTYLFAIWGKKHDTICLVHAYCRRYHEVVLGAVGIVL